MQHFNAVVECREKRRLDRLDVHRAAEITRKTCTSPTSLVLALIYLERLRSGRASAYLEEVSPTELFLATLMVASKFLYDDGEVDEVCNDDWAAAGNIDVKEMNGLEIDFLCAVEWNVGVRPEEFEQMTRGLETAAALRQLRRSSPNTYADLDVLSRAIGLNHLLALIANCTLSVTAVCAAAYAVSVAAMVGTFCLLDRTPVGPRTLNSSMTLLMRGRQQQRAFHAHSDLGADVVLDSENGSSAAVSGTAPIQASSIPSGAGSSALTVTTSIVLGSLAKANETDFLSGGGEDDDSEPDGDSFGGNESRADAPSLLDSLGNSLLRRWDRDRDLPDRTDPNWHATSVLVAPSRAQELYQLWKTKTEKWRRSQCLLSANDHLRKSIALLTQLA